MAAAARRMALRTKDGAGLKGKAPVAAKKSLSSPGPAEGREWGVCSSSFETREDADAAYYASGCSQDLWLENVEDLPGILLTVCVYLVDLAQFCMPTVHTISTELRAQDGHQMASQVVLILPKCC